VTDVALRGVPAALYRLVAEHHDEVIRELKLLDPQTTSAELSLRLLELGPLLGTSFASLVGPLGDAMVEARQRGEASADAVVPLDAEGVRALRGLHEVLCAADDASRAGDLLVLPLVEEAVALRAWIVEEATRQVEEGAAPRTWDGSEGA
jgi:hypothetical protein